MENAFPISSTVVKAIILFSFYNQKTYVRVINSLITLLYKTYYCKKIVSFL